MSGVSSTAIDEGPYLHLRTMLSMQNELSSTANSRWWEGAGSQMTDDRFF